MIKVVRVDEEVVNNIQAKDVEAQVAKDVISQLVETHNLDEDVSFMQSPVFQALQKDAAQKQIEFEKVKQQMASKHIPADIKDKAKEWNLDYYTCEMTIQY